MATSHQAPQSTSHAKPTRSQDSFEAWGKRRGQESFKHFYIAALGIYIYTHWFYLGGNADNNNLMICLGALVAGGEYGRA